MKTSKRIAGKILPELQTEDAVKNHDSSTNGLINAWKQRAAREGVVYKQISFNFPIENDETIVDLYEKAITPKTKIIQELHGWYLEAKQSEFDEFKSVVKMIRKHENEIINFFECKQTNAKAERLNGKINRFISNNYGIKDKDFAMYRIANYFS